MAAVQDRLTQRLKIDGRFETLYLSSPETAGGHTLTNHYNDSTDSPSWTDNGDSTWTRDISGIDGNLAASQASAGTVTLELPDLKGNVGAIAPDTTSATGVTATYAYTEFGIPETGVTDPTKYGSLGAKQRSTGDLGGLSLMGERLYDAVSGRFLQVDPEPGGSASRYDYCDGDPVNCDDLNGPTTITTTGGVIGGGHSEWFWMLPLWLQW